LFSDQFELLREISNLYQQLKNRRLCSYGMDSRTIMAIKQNVTFFWCLLYCHASMMVDTITEEI